MRSYPLHIKFQTLALNGNVADFIHSFGYPMLSKNAADSFAFHYLCHKQTLAL